MTPMIAAVTQTQMMTIVRMHRQGLTAKMIGYKTRRGKNQIRRYLRIYDKEGIEAFALPGGKR